MNGYQCNHGSLQTDKLTDNSATFKRTVSPNVDKIKQFVLSASCDTVIKLSFLVNHEDTESLKHSSNQEIEQSSYCHTAFYSDSLIVPLKQQN